MDKDSLLWEKRIMTSVATYGQGYIWFFNDQQNVMMRLNPRNWKIEIICDLQGYDPENDSESSYLIMEGNTVYKLELTGKRILVCNIEKKLCKYVEIGCNYQDWGNFAGFAKYGDNIFIFPRLLKSITKVSVTNLKVSKIEQTYLHNQDVNEEMFFCSVQREHEMWLFSRSKRIVIQYDMRNDAACLKYLPEKIQFCVDVVAENNDFYILDTNNAVFKWNIENNSVDLIWESSVSSQIKMEFGKLVVTKKRFILMPSLGNDILIINRENNEMMEYEMYPNDFKYLDLENWTKYLEYCQDDKYFYFPMRSANYVLSIEKESGMLSWHKPQFVQTAEYVYYMNYSGKTVIENEWKMTDFLLYILNNNDKSMHVETEELIGTNIHRYNKS